jgi:hypothetical protein
MLNSLFDQLVSVTPAPSEKTKTQSKKQKILGWLAHIGETDPEIIEDTLARCRADQETMQYFLNRANETDRSKDAKI